MNISGFKSSVYSIRRKLTTLSNLIQYKNYTANNLPVCYYPEYIEKRKSTQQINREQKAWIRKYSRPNDFYFLYGFDIKGFRNSSEYIENKTEFGESRERLNKQSKSPYVILRDKMLFGLVADGLGFRTPHNVALIDDKQLFIFGSNDKQGMDINSIKTELPSLNAFAKLIDGECANGVFRIQTNNGRIFIDGKDSTDDDLEKQFNGHRYIIQQRIEQHDAIKAVFPKSINTIRLVTVYDKKEDRVVVFSAVLRVGTGNNHVDNWAAGGLSIGIDELTGELRKYGFYKPGFGTKVAEHPDTHVVFEGYKIPYFAEAVEMAKQFHYYIKGVHSIGWDIAITLDGPCFIEGNDNWEISLMQVCNHGLQQEFERYFIL